VIPPDHEIFEVEARIAARRAMVTQHVREAGHVALRKLSSPGALISAAVLGFFVGGGLTRRQKKPEHPERRKSDHVKAAKATGIVGALTTGAMWLIRLKYGSPVRFAQAMLEKFQRRKPATSPRSDKRPPLYSVRP
jgi:hypothetical protein